MTKSELAEYTSKMASELVGYGEDLIKDTIDHGQKVEFLCECFSEALLGLFKCYVIMNPHVDPSQLVDDFANELDDKLSNSFGNKIRQMVN